jgi:hypothetical protein
MQIKLTTMARAKRLDRLNKCSFHHNGADCSALAIGSIAAVSARSYLLAFGAQK